MATPTREGLGSGTSGVAERSHALRYHPPVTFPTLQRWHFLSALAVCGGVVLGLANAFGPCTQDDAFISLRYAQNLVDGNGLVYNPGERVEGYTNLLWTLLLALPLAVGADPVTSSAGLGLLHFLGAIGAAGLVGRQIAGRSWWALAPPVLVVLDPFASLEAVEGLETAQYMMVLAVGLWLFLRDQKREGAGWGRFLPSSMVFALAALVRPEAPLLPALLHAGRLVHGLRMRPGDGGRILRESLAAGAPIAIVLVVLSVWRLGYYGELFPNTFHAKTGAAGFAEGLHYLKVHAKDHPGVWCLMVVGLLWGWKDRCSMAVMVSSTGFLVYVASVGGDFKPTGRFILPVVIWMSALGAGVAARMAPRRGALVALLVLGSTLVRLPAVLDSAHGWAERRHANLAARQLVGTFLREQLPPDTWIAIHSAGAIPFFSRLPTIDMWGLTDHHIARAPVPEHTVGLVGHQRGDPAYVFARAPAIYLPEDKVFTLRAWQLEVEPGFPGSFAEEYESITIPLEGRFLNVWVRRGFLRTLHGGD